MGVDAGERSPSFGEKSADAKDSVDEDDDE